MEGWVRSRDRLPEAGSPVAIALPGGGAAVAVRRLSVDVHLVGEYWEEVATRRLWPIAGFTAVIVRWRVVAGLTG